MKTRWIPILMMAFLFSGCTTPPKNKKDAATISAHFQERLTLEEARQRILGALETDLQKLNARLQENLSPVLRQQLTTDRELLEKDLLRRREKFDAQTATYNAAIDEIRTYRIPARTGDGRGSESGIVLVQGDQIIYLWRLTLD